MTLSGAFLGLSLADVASVDIDGTDCVLTGATPTEINCTVGAHAVGVFPVSVTTDSGGAYVPPGTGSAVDFEFVNPPVIAAVTPSVGPQTGGAVVTISGTGLGFGASDVAEVDFSGIACTPTVFTGLPSSLVCVTASAGSLLSGLTVSVETVTGGVSSLANAYSFDDAVPYVTGIVPDAGPTLGGQTVVVTGANLPTAGTFVSVTMGGVVCGSPDTSNLPTSVSCVTAETLSGTYAVIVTSMARSGVAETNYTFSGSPYVTGVDPPFIPLDGGINVTISGSDLGTAASDIEAVDVGGSPCTPVTNGDGLPFSFTCLAPSQATAGTYPVLVNSTSGGPGVVGADAVYGDCPFVTGISPSSVSERSTGASLTLSGFGLGTTSADEPVIDVGGVTCDVTDASGLPHVVTCQLAADAAGPGPAALSVTTALPAPCSPSYYLSPGVDFVFNPAPVVTSITPTYVPVGSTAVTIGGMCG